MKSLCVRDGAVGWMFLAWCSWNLVLHPFWVYQLRKKDIMRGRNTRGLPYLYCQHFCWCTPRILKTSTWRCSGRRRRVSPGRTWRQCAAARGGSCRSRWCHPGEDSQHHSWSCRPSAFYSGLHSSFDLDNTSGLRIYWIIWIWTLMSAYLQLPLGHNSSFFSMLPLLPTVVQDFLLSWTTSSVWLLASRGSTLASMEYFN